MAGVRGGSAAWFGGEQVKSAQRGVALVLVLWVVSLLAVIAGNFAYSMRGEAQIARNLVSTAQARALADAGIHRAWYELTRPPSDTQRWLPDGIGREMNVPGAAVKVTIQDESGKIDLNIASDDLLKGLFRSVGLAEDASVALVDAIVDWRDPDKLRRLHGAEEAEYRAAGKGYVPTNAPFETVDEIQRVLGMTPELYRAVKPALTVHSKLAGVNPAASPREALLAIPGVSSAMVEQYLAIRLAAWGAGAKAPPFAAGSAYVTATAGVSVYSVRSVATMADGSVFVRDAIARVTPDPRRPIAVLAWAEGDTP